jgi:hypothetical protein
MGVSNIAPGTLLRPPRLSSAGRDIAWPVTRASWEWLKRVVGGDREIHQLDEVEPGTSADPANLGDHRLAWQAG